MIDRILLDMDGVLVDFIGGAKKLHNVHVPNHPHVPATQTEQAPWEIEPIFGMSAPELWDPMGRSFWANLDPLPQMPSIVGQLEARFGEENICLLTSPIRTDGCIDGKMDWIKKHLPQYRRRFLVGPAKQFCASERHALVDDHAKNIEAFKDAGGYTFLSPAPWNCRFAEDPVTALSVWLESI